MNKILNGDEKINSLDLHKEMHRKKAFTFTIEDMQTGIILHGCPTIHHACNRIEEIHENSPGNMVTEIFECDNSGRRI